MNGILLLHQEHSPLARVLSDMTLTNGGTLDSFLVAAFSLACSSMSELLLAAEEPMSNHVRLCDFMKLFQKEDGVSKRSTTIRIITNITTRIWSSSNRAYIKSIPATRIRNRKRYDL